MLYNELLSWPAVWVFPLCVHVQVLFSFPFPAEEAETDVFLTSAEALGFMLVCNAGVRD